MALKREVPCPACRNLLPSSEWVLSQSGSMSTLLHAGGSLRYIRADRVLALANGWMVSRVGSRS